MMEAVKIEDLKRSAMKRGKRIKCMCIDLIVQHLAIMLVSYTGFLRFATSKRNLHQMIIMSHVIEFVA
jgi:hypothetical protein